jgi:hypothetical protein
VIRHRIYERACYYNGCHSNVLRDVGSYMIFMNVRVFISVVVVMLFRDVGPYWIMFTNVCCYNCCHGKAFWASSSLCVLIGW